MKIQVNVSYGLLFSLIKFFTRCKNLELSFIILGRLCVLVQNRAIYDYFTYKDNIIR